MACHQGLRDHLWNYCIMLCGATNYEILMEFIGANDDNGNAMNVDYQVTYDSDYHPIITTEHLSVTYLQYMATANNIVKLESQYQSMANDQEQFWFLGPCAL